MGNLVFQATLGGQVNLVGPNTASTFNINVPTVNGNLVTTGDTGTVTNTMCATSVYTAPGTIGSGTPNTGAFTTLSASGVASFAAGSASAPALTRTGDTNTGMFFPAADTIAFAEGGTETMRLDSSGNMGLGVTPSAWSAQKAVELPNGVALASYTAGVNIGQMFTNAYYNGTNYIYKNSDYAEQYAQRQGAHIWYNSASGTAGNTITFTQAMTLDASGRLTVGYTSAGNAERLGASGTVISTGQSINTFSYDQAGFDYNASTKEGRFFSTASGGAGFITFYTASGSERARIDSSGNLLVGTTGTVYSGKIGVSFNGNGGAGAQGIALIDTNASLSGDYALFVNSSGNVAGRITHNGTTTVAYTTSSDYRLKENIAPMTGALAKVAALKPVTYSWKDDKTSSEGFIAHELAEVCPHAVVGAKDAVDTDGNPVYQGIDTSFLVATLTAAIQELKAEFDAYKATHP